MFRTQRFLYTLLVLGTAVAQDASLEYRFLQLEERLESQQKDALELMQLEHQIQLADLERQMETRMQNALADLKASILTELEDRFVEVERQLAKTHVDRRKHRRLAMTTSQAVKFVNKKLACVHTSSNKQRLVIDGCNLIVRNGAGSSNKLNGKGNIIVGYDEKSNCNEHIDAFGAFDGRCKRTGSHNVVVGKNHEYRSYGGIVAGERNSIIGQYSSVAGGFGNEVYGRAGSILGGDENRITHDGHWCTVVGGEQNVARTDWGSVVGGFNNRALGDRSVVVGGGDNKAHAAESVVVGGDGNDVRQGAVYGVVLGGFLNHLEGQVDENGDVDNKLGECAVLLGGERLFVSGEFNVSGPVQGVLTEQHNDF